MPTNKHLAERIINAGHLVSTTKDVSFDSGTVATIIWKNDRCRNSFPRQRSQNLDDSDRREKIGRGKEALSIISCRQGYFKNLPLGRNPNF